MEPEQGQSNDSVDWAVWRQDDHGNAFLIRKDLSQKRAEAICSELEARGHKQIYWVSPWPEEEAPPRPTHHRPHMSSKIPQSSQANPLTASACQDA